MQDAYPGNTRIFTSTKPAERSTLSASLDALEATAILKYAPAGSPSDFVKLILAGPAVRNSGVEIDKALVPARRILNTMETRLNLQQSLNKPYYSPENCGEKRVGPHIAPGMRVKEKKARPGHTLMTAPT